MPDLVGYGPWSARTEQGLPSCLWPYANRAPQTVRKRRREEGGGRREGKVAKHECSMSDVTSHRQTLLVRLVSLIIVQEPP